MSKLTKKAILDLAKENKAITKEDLKTLTYKGLDDLETYIYTLEENTYTDTLITLIAETIAEKRAEEAQKKTGNKKPPVKPDKAKEEEAKKKEEEAKKQAEEAKKALEEKKALEAEEAKKKALEAKNKAIEEEKKALAKSLAEFKKVKIGDIFTVEVEGKTDVYDVSICKVIYTDEKSFIMIDQNKDKYDINLKLFHNKQWKQYIRWEEEKNGKVEKHNDLEVLLLKKGK